MACTKLLDLQPGCHSWLLDILHGGERRPTERQLCVHAGNFAEYLPPLIISLGLLEVQQIFSPFYLHVFGATALGLRLAHTLQLRVPEKLPIVLRQARASQRAFETKISVCACTLCMQLIQSGAVILS